ncbi:MAG: 2-deoxy-5-keto-D-gluconate 6-phosphate aldolase domain-containing protein, partial [Pseudorhodobacter sp.]
AARRWFAGELADAQAVAEMQTRYARLCGIWDKARGQARVAV